MNNDIAIIKLKGEGFHLEKHVQAICLPNVDTDYVPGKNCTISGWGSTQSGKLCKYAVLFIFEKGLIFCNSGTK